MLWNERRHHKKSRREREKRGKEKEREAKWEEIIERRTLKLFEIVKHFTVMKKEKNNTVLDCFFPLLSEKFYQKHIKIEKDLVKIAPNLKQWLHGAYKIHLTYLVNF